ncbi:YwhD family protein [Pontibacillus sp. ALD_SL1]|uniref:YwhD family protein n=1 Tax=Pontibacillus sp. ALD_SL1 TaxID=2777185 RepID=UPI001A96D06B|nr:YwhD family protein [Pontibacillus sp. ALD_SL1]QSS99884.1 YwhD family protein [Pontibacillus sp. ALD_SL1]
MSSNDQSNNKKKNQFTILKDDSTDGHGGYGVGSVSLENMSPVMIDPNEGEAYIDMGAMHARSKLERRIKFKPDREIAPNGKTFWIVWVTVDHNENGPYYAGVTGCEMVIDHETRRGYKSLPEHVNNMDKSLKGKIIVENMDDPSKKILVDFLRSHNADMWANSSDELKAALPAEQ